MRAGPTPKPQVLDQVLGVKFDKIFSILIRGSRWHQVQPDAFHLADGPMSMELYNLESGRGVLMFKEYGGGTLCVQLSDVVAVTLMETP